MTLKLETLDIVGKAAEILQSSEDGVRGLLAAFYDLWPERVPDSWEAVEIGLQQAGAAVDTTGALSVFLRTLTEDATAGEHPGVVLDDAAMRHAFQRRVEPQREYVVPGSLIFRVGERYFRGEGHEVWQVADDFGSYFHDGAQNYDSKGNVLLDEVGEDSEAVPEVSGAQAAAPDYDALCAQAVIHYAIPALTRLVSSSPGLAASRTRDELIAGLSSTLAHHLCGRDVPGRADELIAALAREAEQLVHANPQPAAQFFAAFSVSGPHTARQWLDYRFDEDLARIDEALSALPRLKAEAETPAVTAPHDLASEEVPPEPDLYDALLARILEEEPRALEMPPGELHALVALTLSE